MSRRWGRLSGVVVLALSALMFTGVSAADNSITLPYTNEAFNECNGELVDVQGTIHMESHSTTNANGTHIEITMNLAGVKGTAVVPPTGARYVESNTDNSSTNFSSDFVPSESTHEVSEVLTRLGEDGTPDDFRYHLAFHTTVNANGVPTVDRTDSRIECN